MVVIIGVLCAVVGLLAGFLLGTGKAKKDWQEQTRELVEARQKACDDMIAAQDKRHAEAPRRTSVMPRLLRHSRPSLMRQ